MSITIPKPLIPILKLPKIPGWVAVAALVLQFAITNNNSSSQPECRINVQQVHNSTYSYEFKNLDEIKLNVTTECDSPQLSSKVKGELFKEGTGGGYTHVYSFEEVLVKPKPERPNFVSVESLAIPCEQLGDGKYLGSARATVLLRNHKVTLLSGISNKARLIKCSSGAK